MSEVAFYRNGQLIANDNNAGDGWSASFLPDTQGTYNLEAIATDNLGAKGTSAPVSVNMIAPFKSLYNPTNTHPTRMSMRGNINTNHLPLKYSMEWSGNMSNWHPVTNGRVNGVIANSTNIPAFVGGEYNFEGEYGNPGSPAENTNRNYRIKAEVLP